MSRSAVRRPFTIFYGGTRMNRSTSRKRRTSEVDHRALDPLRTSPAAGTSGTVRPVRLRTSGASMRRLADGSILVQPDEALRPYPIVLTDRVHQWAKRFPDRICIAKRDARREWSRLTYAQVFESVRRIGQSLLNRQLSADRPIAILSENDLEHFLLTLAGMHVGIPIAPISPSYSLLSKDFNRVRHALNLVTPGLIFASDGTRFRGAIEATVADDTELVVTSSPPPGRKSTLFSEVLAAIPGPEVEAGHARIHPDDVAKILFTSGSTGVPRGVLNTHRMICSNLQMI